VDSCGREYDCIDELARAVVNEQHPVVTVVLGMTVEAPNLVSFSALSAV
jgi:hypothetical protein